MRAMVLFLVLVTATPVAHAGILEAVHHVTLEDPAGDVQPSEEGPALDLTRLDIASDGAQLAFTLALATPAAKVLAATNEAGAVVTVFLDTDDDPATGATTLFGGRKPGFEHEVEIKACIRYERGQACGGGLADMKQQSYFPAWGVRKAEGNDFKKVHDVFWESPKGPIEGNTLSVSVPYAELGLAPGKKVRIAVQEQGGGFGPEGFLPEVRLTPK